MKPLPALKAESRATGRYLLCVDSLAVLGAFLLSYRLYFHHLHVPIVHQVALLAGLLVTTIVFSGLGLHEPRQRRGFSTELGTLALAWVSVFSVLAGLAVLTDTAMVFVREWALLWLLFGLLFMAALRVLLGALVPALRFWRLHRPRVVVIGQGDAFLQANPELGDSDRAGIEIVGYFGQEETDRRTPGGMRRLGNTAEVVKFVRTAAVDEIWVVLPLSTGLPLSEILNALGNRAKDVRVLPDLSAFKPVQRAPGLPPPTHGTDPAPVTKRPVREH